MIKQKFLEETLCKKCNRFAFTLAEVLITLGIIGVVAALTLPSVINKFKVKQLEASFKRTSSLIEAAAKDTAVYFGYDNFKDFNSICGNVAKVDNAACKTNSSTTFEEINNYFLSRFNKIREFKANEVFSGVKVVIFMTNFSGMTKTEYHQLYNNKFYLLNDGSLMTGINFFYHEPSDGLSITFDTNGPKRGPNRYGYDIFLYNTGYWYKLCTATSDGGIYNGRGCYDYALKNENPNDGTKGYWESLK